MSYRPFHIIIFIFTLLHFAAFSQLQLYPSTSIIVSKANQSLSNAWAGGINNAQISNFDLNHDGKLDLFIFDRARNLASVFIFDNGKYHYAPTYTDSFPSMTSWAFLLDYNKDGKADIFTSNTTLIQNKNSFKVFQNTGDEELEFSLLKGEVKSTYYGIENSLYVTGTDLPAFSDIDNDGDIDMLTFDVTGSAIEFHSNRSMELYGNADSIVFALRNACWGNVNEDPFTNALSLNQTCSPIVLKTQLHSGSTLCVFDNENDGDKDLLIGDLLFNALTFGNNGGNNLNANITSQDANFPNYNTPVNLTSFPAAFIADIDQNTHQDLLVAPNNKGEENYNCLHYYKNTSTNNVAQFELQEKDFLVNSMLDFGSTSYPVFFDYNDDGLIDLLVANDGIYDVNQNTQVGKMALLVNTGSANTAQFEWQENDFANLSQYNITAMKPTFGDLDNDGDDDMLIGAFNGQIHYFKNTAGVGNNANFVIETPIFQSIDVGAYSTPMLFDLNKDGLLDLIIGEQDGNLNYYKNTGSLNTPIFTLQTNTLGNVNVSDGFLSGFSVPHFYDYNGNTHLLVGCAKGTLHHYTNIDGNLNGTFTQQTTNFSKINTGIQSSVTMAKLTNNDKYILVAGNKSGGLQLFSEIQGDNVEEILNNYLLHSYYAQQSIYLAFDENINLQNISIYNILGEEVMQKTLSNSDKKIDVKSLSTGCYISKINFTQNGNNYFAFLKFVQ